MRRSLFAAAFLACSATAPAYAAEPFHFVAFGDMPYKIPEAYAPFERLLVGIDAAKPAFSIHVGDIKSGSSPCTDAAFQKIHDYFMNMEAPLFFTPGDNEWTDCHRKKAGRFDPQERLAKLREMFFAEPKSLGKTTMDYVRQSDVSSHTQMVENALWSHEGVLFATAHIVGSNNGLERSSESAAEHFARDAANVEWIAGAFAKAQEDDAAAVVLAIHANPGFEVDKSWDYSNSGFKNTVAAIADGAKKFGKPALVIHGDSHRFQINRPLRACPKSG